MSTEMFKELLVTEKDLLKDAVAKARELIGIEEKTGRVILRVPRGSLGQRQVAALHLIGQYFAKQMELADSASLSLDDLSERSGIDSNTLSGRLSELVKVDWVHKLGKAKFEINQYLLNDLLDEIISSRRKSELAQPLSQDVVPQSLSEGPNSHQLPTISKGKGLTDTITHLMSTSWGKTPRDWSEIHEALKRNALHYSKGSLTGTLTLLTQTGRLRRIKEGRSYRYVVP